MTNKSLTVSGLIIKETKVGEGNKIFTMLTSDCGKLQAGASGVRNYKSKLSSGCSLFCYAKFLLKQGKSLYNITSAETIYNFYSLSSDITKLAYATYFCDLLGLATVEDEAGGALNLALNTLYYLEKKAAVRITKPVFELRLMMECGFMPNVYSCHKCGTHENLTYFSINDGVVYCKACGGHNISRAVISAMQYIFTSQPKKIFSFSLDDTALCELSDFAERFTLSQLEKTPHSLSFLKSCI